MAVVACANSNSDLIELCLFSRDFVLVFIPYVVPIVNFSLFLCDNRAM